MSYLITGGTGFLGNNFVRHMLDAHPNKTIINYSRHTYAVNPNSTDDLLNNPNYKLVAGDLRNILLLSKTLEENNVEKVFHLAASTHVDRSFTYPEEFLDTNVCGTFSLLEAIRHMKKRPLMIHASTDEVFGDVPETFCRETDMLAPRNPYSASKAAAEMYCNAYHHSYEMPIIIFRSMNMFGEYQHPEKLISKIITRCLTDTHFTLYQGNSIRGWIYVKDTCNALDILGEQGTPGEIYHIPPDIYLTVSEIAEKILALTEKTHLFDGYKGKRLKDDERYALDATKFTYRFRWAPKVGFEQGLRNTVKWFDENRWHWGGLHS